MNIAAEIKRLRKQLDIWSKEYYEFDNPTVSDQEYDAAYTLLVKLEEENPGLITPDSITQRVGGKTDNRFMKVKHKEQMLSLSNAFDFEDLKKFDKQIKDQLGWKDEIEYALEYKIDGLSISIEYVDGKLFRAVTRGDGSIGEDVTHNVMTIRDIPKEIMIKEDITFRGEIYMSNEIFESLNKNGNNFANPRNAASGTIRQLDSSVATERKLNAFIYSIPNPEQYNLSTHEETLKFIDKNGFKINEYSKVVFGFKSLPDTINSLMMQRGELDYEVDGIVIKVNDVSKWPDIGYTAKFPKFMIAYKFPEEVATTKLLDIFPTIGRTGRVTYNAKLSPIRLAGTTVQAATLHNADYIRDLNLSIGDEVNVKKAGEIIPKVLSVYKKNNLNIWEEAKVCPACGSTLIRVPGEVDQYCTNDYCPQRNIATLEHFVSRQAMDIEGLSSERIKTFIDAGIISDIPSIFDIPNKALEILSLPKFQEKSFSNLSNAIEKSKTRDIDKFIFGLGIRHVGAKNAKTLAKRFGTLESLASARIEDIFSIRDLGEKVSESVVNFFSNESNKQMIIKMINKGLKLKELEERKSIALSGLTFVITGTLSQSRDFFKDLIESHDGNVSASVTSKTNYLLAGEKAGSKLEKANALNVNILNEKQLYALIEEGGSNG